MADTAGLTNTLHHLSIKTASPKTDAENFYRGFMGLPFVREVKIGPDILLYFELAGNLLLEVILTGGSSNGRQAENGFAHFAFTVSEIAPWLRKVQDAGYEITYGPAILPELKINTFLFIDPFGAEWELMEDTE